MRGFAQCEDRLNECRKNTDAKIETIVRFPNEKRNIYVVMLITEDSPVLAIVLCRYFYRFNYFSETCGRSED